MFQWWERIDDLILASVLKTGELLYEILLVIPTKSKYSYTFQILLCVQSVLIREKLIPSFFKHIEDTYTSHDVS